MLLNKTEAQLLLGVLERLEVGRFRCEYLFSVSKCVEINPLFENGVRLESTLTGVMEEYSTLEQFASAYQNTFGV